MKEHVHQGGIGDVNSETRGAGARFNTGKVPLELIPLRIVADQLEHVGYADQSHIRALRALGRFQEGAGVGALYDSITEIGADWDACADVFDYGRRKYAEWNWAKGMAWSVPIACAARHLLHGLVKGEANDRESGKPHRGHFLCNIVMLITFVRTYPEGDDRPSRWLSGSGMQEHAALEDDARLIAVSNASVA
ncbi:dATP/dGTP diphosphohydrolase domain-containing protein [Paraburkholderia phenoliruptrix]|uniref:dATP/dGTP diphosphohydrolase domain-containing protein n=1 Tax=Paraburkholderia phenoliruptrix TaxID=252970 RepID=UPI0034CD8DDA